MLKQSCQTLIASRSCGTSFTPDNGLVSQISVKYAKISTFLDRAIAWVAIAFTVREERRVLAGLTSHQLDDIGLSNNDVQIESQRPYWDVPADRSARSVIYRIFNI
ncbi:DUF1127 domain-containing protein [Kiloniella antarctica]|uniref:DUF1127 domain-containing protein n=1 Tax=Kiloniella antarctica TaxID=1550907 RepID=A0ABW5BMR7_9PROT